MQTKSTNYRLQTQITTVLIYSYMQNHRYKLNISSIYRT